KGDRGGVLAEVKASGLRGRGGAGFDTGLKWEILAGQPNGRGKVLVCNADEGDPGAYMDRSLLEGNPHSIIEGMLIGAFATGASEGVVYVRDEYPLAIKHLIIALRQAREFGLMGRNMLGTDFSFELEMMRGAGAFVCGEETALMRSIEGKMGEPRQRPPYPAQKGIDGKPTSINNVETWANIPVIFEEGAESFRSRGTRGSAGTKIFSLVGKARNTGLVEVPMGVTVGEIVFEIGGGPAGKAPVKAVQTGGPSGGCIPASQFNLTVDYDGLARAGAIMGSGGMIVFDEHTCVVDVARYYMNFLKSESCGKCFSCRKGTQRMHEILEDICSGKAKAGDLELLEELALVVKDTTMCGLGQTAPNPVLSTLRYFRGEYLEHVNGKRCPAGVCPELTGAPCQSACPLGTEAWRYVAHIRRGEYDEAYRVIRAANPFPSVCARVCHHPCEERCRLGTTGGQPVAIRALKRFITETVDPSSWRPRFAVRPRAEKKAVAVIGAGPAGLTAAHLLSLRGYPVTLFEAAEEPGGMLRAAIPAYRLNRDVLDREIKALLTNGIAVQYGKKLGRDFTLDSLGGKFQAVLVATGTPRGRRLEWQDGRMEGVHDALDFLRAWNFQKKELGRGHVAVIGGGNSAVDAARAARRQKGVESVTILYRRTRQEMPAFAEEVEAALQEGVRIETMISPLKPVAEAGALQGIVCVRNRAGEREATGRCAPVPIAGSEHTLRFDTLIVAVGEEGEEAPGIETNEAGNIRIDAATLQTSRPGVFAAGDSVTGAGTVVEAIAAGKKAALIIERYLEGEPLDQPGLPRLPEFHIPAGSEPEETRGVRIPLIPADARVEGYEEIEKSITEEEAVREAGRCLRCDLEFTAKQDRGSRVEEQSNIESAM
ncbi:MAG TPA: NADH-ubiquinone oxidoreductase-F iron-sulfur binding region domain-containing protein, partial [Thermodesulfobacteriota bacterium]|nr:NADH-ubiquinone oxidoreductase-F iron-sulfur binding region domain-containing protein [Thermodesulfobacteriota bacterium]